MVLLCEYSMYLAPHIFIKLCKSLIDCTTDKQVNLS